MRLLIAIIFSFAFHFTYAQHKVTLIVEGAGNYDTIFVAGNFNGWQPGDAASRLTEASALKTITLNLPLGLYEFKFTRGSWQTVEATAGGEAVENRIIRLQSDTTLYINIPAWADQFSKKQEQHTASKNVHILDSAFYMPQLKRFRRIWLYLPENYERSTNSYPVLYMHDGQNIFDAQTSSFGEWGIDECLDTLSRELNKYCIVVGIDHGGDKRLNELNPFDHPEFGKGEGDTYLEFIVQTLKPYIDSLYRTKKQVQNTFIAGSSMGGLISMYAITKYPKVFGAAGVFSPAFWVAPSILEEVSRSEYSNKTKIFLFAGQLESDKMVEDMQKIDSLLRKKKVCNITTVLDEEGRHSEHTWRLYFDDFYRWLMENE